MPAGILSKDFNFQNAVGGTSSASDSGASIKPFQYDPITRGLLIHIVGDDVIYTALTASSPTFATVGVTSAEAVASNASRKGLILVNTSANTISLGFGATAVLNSGITLLPGGTFDMGTFDFTTGAVNAIASAASSNMSIQQYT